MKDERSAHPDDPRSQRGLESNQHGPSAPGSAGADLQTSPGRAGFGPVPGSVRFRAVPTGVSPLL
jgi:hypothetical protein